MGPRGLDGVCRGGAMAGTLALEGLRARGWRALRLAAGLAGAAFTLVACAGSNADIEQFTTATPPPQFAEAPPPPAPPPGNGEVRVALILPLSAQGNAGAAAQSMKNAAEMAL